MNLRDIDLNLLVVLDALLGEKSVTRAASKVALSQPAMSNALTRLREMFHDPLLVRGPKGMTPTAKALKLSPQIRRILEDIEARVFEKNEFDPARDRAVFHLMATDIAGPLVGPQIARILREEAPHCTLRSMRLDERTPISPLADGVVDLVIGFRFDDRPGLFAKNLRSEHFVTIARKKHPEIKKTLTLDLFCKLGHVYTSPFGQGKAVVDEALEKLKLSRHVVLTTPNFMTTPFIVASSDILATVPESAARLMKKFLPIEIYPCPVKLNPFPWGIAWHERTHHSPVHQWLRKRVEQVIMEMRSEE